MRTITLSLRLALAGSLAALALSCSNASPQTAQVAAPLEVSSKALYNAVFTIPATARSELFATMGALPANLWQRRVLASSAARSVLIDGKLIDLAQSLEVYQSESLPMADLWKAVGITPESLTSSDITKAAAAGGSVSNADLSLGDSSLPASMQGQINQWLNDGAPDCTWNGNMPGVSGTVIANPTPTLPSSDFDKGQMQVVIYRHPYEPNVSVTAECSGPNCETSYDDPLVKPVQDYTRAQLDELRNRDVVNFITSAYFRPKTTDWQGTGCPDS